MQSIISNPRCIGLLLASCLTACGGGDDVNTALSLKGTAATGMALAGATVRASCASGAASTVTGPDGSYQMFIAGGSLPCALQASAAGGVKLHSLAVGTGTARTAVVNLTPLTDMVTVRFARADAASYFSTFNPNLSQRLTADKVRAAQIDVTTLLLNVVDTTGLSDFIGTPLKAATPGNPQGGDRQDQLLDSLRAKIDAAHLRSFLAQLASDPGPNLPDSGPFAPTLSVGPLAISVSAGAAYQFIASINYPINHNYLRQPVSWQVVEQGGGTIRADNGAYVAPLVPGVYHVRANRDDFPAIAVTVTVTVTAP